MPDTGRYSKSKSSVQARMFERAQIIRREEYLFLNVVATLFIYSIYLFTIFVL
ncbi:hypothetical protein VR7878_03061 [Vibrio ruber DSM 16370]|uniref:Uncharacterized protein n=1 Tax=Vibrio ruber (strain DSM 16370 / JCM 11486 / BCRC 17186 / CECT 7878 / LMG 23124 / VR1) TaxID=1123498 RepID=A0A1R4LQS7_VIBR1|nr:hypothetical protein VR7878_03061 [Vibrio ruber DSM 16370]